MSHGFPEGVSPKILHFLIKSVFGIVRSFGWKGIERPSEVNYNMPALRGYGFPKIMPLPGFRGKTLNSSLDSIVCRGRSEIIWFRCLTNFIFA
jgi:hypothetical protein